DILLQASASDTAGNVTQVQFYTNGFLLGETAIEPFALVWHQPPVGHYRIVARAYDNFYLHADSPSVHLQVGVGARPQLSRGPYLQSGSATNVIVRWRTDWFSDSLVRYGTNVNSLQQAISNTQSVLEHEMNLSGLEAGKFYYYSIGSSSEMLAGGGQFFFRTTPAGADAVRIWAIGDSGTADTNAASVRDAYYSVT